MTLDCVKNVSSIRERNSSQGSFLFLRHPRSQGFEGFFCAVYGSFRKYLKLVFSVVGPVVTNVANLGIILQGFPDILLHKVKFSFLFIWQTQPSAWAIMAAEKSALDVLVVKSAELSVVLQGFLKNLLHGNKLLSNGVQRFRSIR